MNDLQIRVERGAVWLDAIYPEWWTHLDLGTLQLSNCCRCVLGQVFRTDEDDNGYDLIADNLGVTLGWIIGRGFALDPTSNKSWNDLDDAWIAEIKRRWESGASA